MKRIALFALLTLGAAGISSLNAQTEKEKVTKELKKEVTVEEVNGEKVLTIKTTEDGKTTEEIYKGAEAEVKLREMEHHREMEHRREMHKPGPRGPKPPHKAGPHPGKKKVTKTIIVEEEIDETPAPAEPEKE